MKFAGHKNADTFFGSYMPQLSTVDGIASYWNLKRRTVHLEGFRGLSLHYHPQMLQSLPAKVEADLENRVDFADLNKEIAMLGEKLRGVTLEEQSQEDRARREELYWKKRQLVSEELSKWQEIQTHKVGSNEDEASPVASRPSYFNRIRRLDPSRDRLASSLFLHIPLRSPQGRIALQDMITLCKHNPPVAYRPSLRPKNGCCPVPKCAREMGRYVVCRPLISKQLANYCVTALALPPDGVISITATGQTLYIDTALLSSAFSAINGLRITLNGMSTAEATLRKSRPFQFNVTRCFSAKHSPLLGNAYFVYLTRVSYQR